MYMGLINKQFVVMTIFTILITAFFSVGLMLVIHTYLAMTNQTTIGKAAEMGT
jgi:hypothetical protein